MRVRAAVMAALASATVLVLVGCNDANSQAGKSSAVAIEAPTYLPADLPGGFGANPLKFSRRSHGYVVTATAHATTYTIAVATRERGDVPLTSKRLATLAARTELQPDGTIGWTDDVATVSISAVGPAGHTRRGLQTIGKRMVVAPEEVLDDLVAASRARRSRQVALDPIEFPAAEVSLPQAMFGRLGRTKINVESPRETVGTGVCFACEYSSFVTGWREGKTTYALIGVPEGTTVEPANGVEVERRFDPMAGSDLVLLSTARTDTPRVAVRAPGQDAVRYAVAETTT